MYFSVTTHYRAKMKEKEKMDKYIDLVNELILLRISKITVKTISDDVFRMIRKNLDKKLGKLDIRGRIKTNKSTAQLTLVRKIKRFLGAWGELISIQLQWDVTR